MTRGLWLAFVAVSVAISGAALAGVAASPSRGELTALEIVALALLGGLSGVVLGAVTVFSLWLSVTVLKRLDKHRPESAPTNGSAAWVVQRLAASLRRWFG